MGSWGAGRRSKYHAKPTTIDGIRFASKAEAHRYLVLRSMEQAGKISGLELQVPYNLAVNGVHICKYVADFRYFRNDTCLWVVEDKKGVRTREFILKAKLMKAIYGIEIYES